jgi:hypothetical protein
MMIFDGVLIAKNQKRRLISETTDADRVPCRRQKDVLGLDGQEDFSQTQWHIPHTCRFEIEKAVPKPLN